MGNVSKGKTNENNTTISIQFVFLFQFRNAIHDDSKPKPEKKPSEPVATGKENKK